MIETKECFAIEKGIYQIDASSDAVYGLKKNPPFGGSFYFDLCSKISWPLPDQLRHPEPGEREPS